MHSSTSRPTPILPSTLSTKPTTAVVASLLVRIPEIDNERQVTLQASSTHLRQPDSFLLSNKARHSVYNGRDQQRSLREATQQQIMDDPSEENFDIANFTTGRLPLEPRLQLPCYMFDNLPRNPYFVGREYALEAIGETLLPLGETSTTSEIGNLKGFALCGMGGIGETEIAVEFAHRHKNEFDTVLWAHAGSPDALKRSLWQIAVRLGLQDPSDNQVPEANKEALRSWLSDPWKPVALFENDTESSPFQRFRATWLLVFDGADDPLIFQDLWSLHRGSILITSRDPSAKTIFPTMPAGLDLQRLHKDEGALLLKRLTNRAVDEDTAADNLGEIIGGLLLAISQIANISVSRNLSLEEMYRLYNQPIQHPNLHSASIASKYPYNLATVWKMETLSPAAKTLLDTLSFLDPVQIREQLFTNIYHDHGVLGFPKDRASFRGARSELMRSSLVKWNKEGFDLTLHGVGQDVANAKLEDDRFNVLFSFTVFLIWFKWPSAIPGASRRNTGLHPKRCNQRDIVSRWPWCASLYPHVVRLKFMWELTNDISAVTKMRSAALLNNAAW